MPIDPDAYMSGVIPTLSRGGSWLPDQGAIDDNDSQPRPPVPESVSASGVLLGPSVRPLGPDMPPHPPFVNSSSATGPLGPALKGWPNRPLFRTPWRMPGTMPLAQPPQANIGPMSPILPHPLNILSPYGPVRQAGWSKFNAQVLEGGPPSTTASESLGKPFSQVPSSHQTGQTPLVNSARQSGAVTYPNDPPPKDLPSSPTLRFRHGSKRWEGGSWERQAGAPKPLTPEPIYKGKSKITHSKDILRPRRPKAESLPEAPPLTIPPREEEGVGPLRGRYESHPSSQSGKRPLTLRRHTSVVTDAVPPSVKSAASPLSPYRLIDQLVDPSSAVKAPKGHPVNGGIESPAARTQIVDKAKVKNRPQRPFPTRRYSHEPSSYSSPKQYDSDTSSDISKRARHASSPSLTRSSSDVEMTTGGANGTVPRSSRKSKSKVLDNWAGLKAHLPAIDTRAVEQMAATDSEARRQRHASKRSGKSGPGLARMTPSTPTSPRQSKLSMAAPSTRSSDNLTSTPSDHTHGYISPTSPEGYDRYATHPSAPVPDRADRDLLHSSSCSASSFATPSQAAFAATATTQTPNRSDTINKQDWYLPVGYARPTAPAPPAKNIRERPAVIGHGVPWVIGEERSNLSERPEGPRWVQARPPRADVIRGGAWWESGGEGQG